MGAAAKVLIVDDDSALCDSLVEWFSLHDEFAAVAVQTARLGIETLKRSLIDIVILDVNLPDLDGREACKVMRRDGYKGPVIMLSGQDSAVDAIVGLEAGANDYVTKPFKFSVLLARIRAHLRQNEHCDSAVYRIGPYTFRPSTKVLVGDDHRTVPLTEKEASILKYLYRARDRVVEREVLLREVWGYSPEASSHTVETHIYRLRQKMEPNPSRARILLSEGRGYKLRP